MGKYDLQFYDEQTLTSQRSAAVVVPIVMKLLTPNSVVDIGCGTGAWLAQFARAGVQDYVGIDGSYVPQQQMLIPADRFRPTELAEPFHLLRRYDLAVCLEVAEHLDISSAAGFIRCLTDAAPVVLFSAAIPRQGGTHHVNEQWPDYWRALFRQHGYVAVDALRSSVWGRTDVSWWLQQNMLLFCSNDAVSRNQHLKPVPEDRELGLVHPNLYRGHIENDPSLRRILPILPRLLLNAIRRRLRK
jgi:SAM-dependent methyltransferase